MTTSQDSPGAPSIPAHPHHAQRWLILGVLGAAQLMVVLDATIVNIALPSAQEDLGFSHDARQWVITAYALAFGALLPLGGRVGDLMGRKRALLIGLIGFAAASAIGGAATDIGMLVTARAAQGVFGALLAPATLSLLMTTFTDARERAKAFGIYGAIAGAGLAAGLLLGGVLTQWLDWRWCLYVNIVIAVVTVAGAWTTLHHQAPEGPRPRLDIPGTLTVSAGLFCLVNGFANAETHAWGEPAVWACLVAAVVLLTVFTLIETRVAHPLIPLRVLFDRTRGAALLSVMLLGLGQFGVLLFLTYYFQQNLGLSPISSGAAFVPMIAGLAVTATAANSILVPRYGARPLVPTGFVVAGAGLFWLTGIDTTSSYTSDVLGPLIVTGIGTGMAIAPAMTAGISGVRAEDAGAASALMNTGQQVGYSVGTAVLSSIAASALTDQLAGQNSISSAVAAGAAVHSYTTTFMWCAVIFLIGAVISGALLRSGPLAQDPDAGPVVHV
ncbi:MFS transporter [Kineosporia babensis]|uniref:MFS transporter n=1 Tax=Kineosporia babensis TaxID=499548 RepID=A0A9X1NP55_9ACTN|nr:MFS transporter [Kineosporia babensis]